MDNKKKKDREITKAEKPKAEKPKDQTPEVPSKPTAQRAGPRLRTKASPGLVSLAVFVDTQGGKPDTFAGFASWCKANSVPPKMTRADWSSKLGEFAKLRI